MISRRKLIELSAIAGAAAGVEFLLPWYRKTARAQQSLLNAANHPKFVTSLPKPASINATLGGKFDLEIGETVQSLGLFGAGGNRLMTRVWGYGLPGSTVTYPGPTIVAQKDVPIEVFWKNKLPTNKKGGHLLPADTTIHLAMPIKKVLEKGNVPVVTHLHGGHSESASDGLPESWFTQGHAEKGPTWVKKIFKYDNDQEAATLWYHDHALGITRLNVYAGLAGFYFLRDANEYNLRNSGVLPSGVYEREIVIQDRMFTADGQLFYPTTPDVPGAPNPSVLPEFFGDFIIVNGVAWPFLDVEPRKYRFRMLNGSDSRFYVLKFSNGMQFYQIGTDSGFLPKPVPLTQLILAPGERADLIVDFNGKSGQEIVLKNFGPDGPFKGLGMGGSANSQTTGSIVKFRVNQPLSSADATITPSTRLRPDIVPLAQTGPTRQLVLFEGEDEFGRLQPILGTLANGSLGWFEPVTENPALNAVEVWEIYNATEDAHPIHLHLVSFQIINRESFDGTVTPRPQPQHDGSFGVGGRLTVNSLGGDRRDAAANEKGWKDTVIALPGEVTRIRAKFDRPGGYVWHCHILSHEDHEMMRPYFIG
jgi:spore coat protein A, manganese oxidase